MQLKGTQT